MTILKLSCVVAVLFVFHEVLCAFGTRMGADVLTGAAAFLVVVIIGLTTESFV
jgi:hypothetical protein